jgi:hypothetical protein
MGTPTDVQFLSWKDPYAWTEDMTAFKVSAKQENGRFAAAVKIATAGADVTALTEEFAAAAADHVADLLWSFRGVEYRPNLEGGGGYLWKFSGATGPWKDAGDLDVTEEGVVLYTVERGKGQQSYVLQARKRGRIVWKAEPEIAAEFAVLGNTVYALEVDTPLRYNRLITLDATTGGGRHVLFENRDDRWTLRLVKGGNQGLFLIREQAGFMECFHVGPEGLQRIAPDAVCVYPIGVGPEGRPVYLARRKSFTAPWKLFGGGHEFSTDDGIEFASLGGNYITRNFGERIFWGADGKISRKIFGNILVNPLEDWYGASGPAAVWVISPGSTISCVSLKTGRTIQRGRTYANVKDGEAISKDGLPVRWVLAYKGSKPKGLLVMSYGGYGLATPLGTARWRPWLDAGWAIGFALVRGGGDGNEAWASLGRLSGKENGIDDLEAVIVVLQEVTKVSEANTVVFGRSAGGLMVGGIAGRHPHGGLARKIYAEVPYVDLLKTAGNGALPLTPSEYREFGNPRAGPAEFEQTMRSSPVHRLGPEGAPGLRVVCRTGFFDLQVYPYESLKWILALRGLRTPPDDKFLHVAMEGHFTHGSAKYRDMAEDFLLLN